MLRTSGLRLKAFVGFPTQRRSKIISFMAKSSRSCNEIRCKHVFDMMSSQGLERYHILVLTWSYMAYHLCGSVRHNYVYLCNKLDDFDKDIERHVSWYHTAGAFGEKCCHNSVETTVDPEERTHYADTFDKHLSSC